MDWQQVLDLADTTWQAVYPDEVWIREVVRGDWDRIALCESGEAEPRLMATA